ncbi:MAG: UDP-3-O-[3-hydroxymyristoyl] N-acetylglucosamine deacetylase (EC [uncultured Thiotrichaceae bacterium]|uniref:UDP-3-O-acyl-N-acetylglucosamine deacetylase n=1 Tax=uncultured Thiotrichaceae bacterium TaxID=298394 RepID=A0A6S6TNA3_9GAMM|nr:MAG: UDP-3-O-[3-hydroxymyristoyl] N-acetylglucosamine deacetylase (EC [uncultured Thiotrichaceae bacterium]
MQLQRTIKRIVETTGVGVHSGKAVRMVLRPAMPNTGIVFRRIDLSEDILIKATPETVGETVMCTTLVQDGIKVATIEHLFSALAGLGIDNLYVDLDAEEVPILDGSAAPFIYLIENAGIATQAAPKKFVRIKKPIKLDSGYASASLVPYDGFAIDFEIDFNHPAIRKTRQKLSFDLSKQAYGKEISRARTFGFMKDAEMLRSMNLGLGGNLGNAVVMDEYRILNNGLRYDDEFVIHKMLDAIGDLYTLGYGIIGKYIGHKSGHAVNNQLLRVMLEQPESWELIEATDTDSKSIAYGEYPALAH